MLEMLIKIFVNWKWEKSCKTDVVESDDNAAAAVNCWKWDWKFSIMLEMMCMTKWLVMEIHGK